MLLGAYHVHVLVYGWHNDVSLAEEARTGMDKRDEALAMYSLGGPRTAQAPRTATPAGGAAGQARAA